MDTTPTTPVQAIKIRLGRETGADVLFTPEQDDVSRRHAEAWWDPDLDCIVVRDLGSANGTYPGLGAITAADGSIRMSPGQTVILGEQEIGFEVLQRALTHKTETVRLQDAQQQLAAQRQRRNRWIIRLGVFFVVAMIVAALLWWGYQHTQTTREAAETAREAALLAEQARQARSEADLWIAEQSVDVPPDTPMIGPFIDHRDGTLTDTRSGLTWRRCSLGRVWHEQGCVGKPGRYTWNQMQPALEQINREEGLSGHHDWRAPTLIELLTLVTEGQGLLFADAWTGLAVGHYWTTTPWPRGERRYWNVHTGDGTGYWDEAAIPRYVIPVRQGTLPDDE